MNLGIFASKGANLRLRLSSQFSNFRFLKGSRAAETHLSSTETGSIVARALGCRPICRHLPRKRTCNSIAKIVRLPALGGVAHGQCLSTGIRQSRHHPPVGGL